MFWKEYLNKDTKKEDLQQDLFMIAIGYCLIPFVIFVDIMFSSLELLILVNKLIIERIWKKNVKQK